jgi:Ca-activated chloride channel family protein
MELDQVTAPGNRTVDRYLLITLSTPARVPTEHAAPTETGRPPLGLTAVLDVSGSMRNRKIAQAKEAVRQAVRRLHDGDVFSLVTFATEVTSVLEPTPIGRQTRNVVESTLQEIEASGRTALCGGLELGVAKAKLRQQESNLVLLLSDGQANVGETDLEAIGHRAYRARQEGLTVSTLGVGADYNEALMAEIASQGGGRFYHVLKAEQIAAVMAGEVGEMASLAARDAELHLTLPEGATVFPLSTAYPAQQGEGKATISLGDVPIDLELEVTVRLTLPGQPASSRQRIEGELIYRSPAGSRLSTPLNRVTVRFVTADDFELRDGVVAPVARRVLGQMRAANVLGVARAMAKDAAEGTRQASVGLTSLQEYAARLGDEEAIEETQAMEAEFAALRSAPVAAKAAVASAHARQRSTRKFDEQA